MTVKIAITKLVVSILLVVTLSGCSFIACGDRGVDSRYGFLWLKYKCVGDKYCPECKEWVHFQYDCREACKR